MSSAPKMEICPEVRPEVMGGVFVSGRGTTAPKFAAFNFGADFGAMAENRHFRSSYILVRTRARTPLRGVGSSGRTSGRPGSGAPKIASLASLRRNFGAAASAAVGKQ